MDESSRRLERVSRASGDPLACARAAHEHLRAGRFEAALAVLDGAPADGGEVVPLEVTTRALALSGLGRPAAALEAIEAAFARHGGALVDLDAAALQEALGPALDGKAPLGRARAARLLGRLAPTAACVDSLRVDRDPLVRIALLVERPAFTRDERVSRVYGSHGGDYETGHFIAFDATLEHRLRTFELALFAAISTALSILADDAHTIETLELEAAFGDGWGLGGNDQPVDVLGLRRAIERLNALDVLPWRLRHCDIRPYDPMEDEDRFVRRLGRDVGGHPVGRQAPYDGSAPLLARILAKHPFKGPPCPWSELAPLLDEARTTFTPLGARACEWFARRAREGQKL